MAEADVRNCLVKKWTGVSGYGFNLHAEMGKAGHYVGKVDDGSPAEAAGLRDGDRIVEVNHVNIGNENHKQVVSRIKAGGDSVWLLVVDKVGDEYCKNNNITISSKNENVKTIECPDVKETTEKEDGEPPSDDRQSEVENDYETPSEIPPPADAPSDSDHSQHEDDDEDLPPPPPELSELDAAVNSANDEPPKAVEPQPSGESVTPTPAEEPEEPAKQEEPPQPTEPSSQNGNSGQTLTTTPDEPRKMSAAEMRESLAKNRKADPRKGTVISAKEKMRMFQNL